MGSNGTLRLACLGGVIVVLCGGMTGASAEELTLAWKRQPGTSLYDDATGVAADAAGNVYVVGTTAGALGGSIKGYLGDYDAWLMKYDSSGQLVWKRQPGTGTVDRASGVATDASGNVYVAGYTFGSLNAANPNKGSYDAWVMKFDPTGRRIWTRQPGTTRNDRAAGVAADALGNVYVAGSTEGSFGSGNPNKGSYDAWLAKYDGSGHQLWKRQPGRRNEDRALGVAADTAGNVYVAGYTYGSLGGPSRGAPDAWLIKYDASGRDLWRRQPGTSQYDSIYGVATDADGNVYVTGVTEGALAAPGAYKGGRDAWLEKYDPTGRLIWSRQPGTSTHEWAAGVATDAGGNVYVSGTTTGPLGGPVQGAPDGWVMKYDAAGQVRWKRQMGTREYDEAFGVASDAAGDVYVVGITADSLGGANKGYMDAWLMKFSPTEAE